MTAPGFGDGNVKGLPRAVAESFFIPFRSQSQVDSVYLLPVTGFHHNSCQQTISGRIFFLPAVEGWLIPKPASAELKAIIPGHGLIANQQQTQGHNSSIGKPPGQFFQKVAALAGSETAGAFSSLEAR